MTEILTGFQSEGTPLSSFLLSRLGLLGLSCQCQEPYLQIYCGRNEKYMCFPSVAVYGPPYVKSVTWYERAVTIHL